ncbi:MAG: ornithine--oxo-acid transaminase [Actinomycetota bacterium]|jgi:ornithine--oxo-acid transaminase
MSLQAVAPSPRAQQYRSRHLLMCRPRYFAVSYEINPWMDVAVPVDRRRATRQWERLVRTYRDLGHTVEVIDPVLGLPDMVFAANSAVVVDGEVYLAKFLHPERRGEEHPYAAWFAAHGFTTIHEPAFVNEGEGDFAVVGDVMLAGYGFRTDRASHEEAASRLGVPVVSLHLVDPRFYHLDTALAVLGDHEIAYFPDAFDVPSQHVLQQRFPDAVIVSEADALAFGCNAMSDGYHVVVPAQATTFIDALRERGYEPVPVDLSEFRKAGGSAKCCTLELRDAASDLSADAPHTPLELEQEHAAHNYAPLPVTLTRGEGSWVYDAEGRRYLDMLCAYSALNFGHRHPALVQAAHAQLDKLTLTSRAFSNDVLGPYCAELTALCGKEATVLMNTGAEAVETAIKVARRWGYDRKGIAPNAATIIVFDGNFHGRTTTIVSFSSDADSREGFGPFTPGFRRVRYGDLEAVANAIDDTVTAILVEPIQGEAGVVIPPAGFMTGLRDLCRTYNVLLIADEVQSGFGRTGSLFACDHDGVVPDMYVLGKALGGGIMPLSAVVANWDVLDVLNPGSHGSTFGGNPLACAVGLAVIELVRDGSIFRDAAAIEAKLRAGLLSLLGHGVDAVRTRGAWAGIDLDPRVGTARSVAEDLVRRGVLSKDTHGQTLRLSPPLTISDAELSWGLDRLVESVASQAR